MFGVLRFTLAALVVFSHFTGLLQSGWLAVQAFFVLSGFLITGVVTQVYGQNVKGFSRFVAARFLRLYPAYWCLLLVGVVSLALVPEAGAGALLPSLGMPDQIGGWLANLSMIYPAVFPGDIQPRISSPSWSLTIELFYYVLIGAGLTRSGSRAT